jgi:hypothetical protein
MGWAHACRSVARNERMVQSLDGATSLAQLFEVAKRAVRASLRHERAGLMLALADLGNHPSGFLGAFHYVGSNYIVVNKNPLRRLKEQHPQWYNAYAFHVLLHEYIHSLGHIDEAETRRLSYEVSRDVLGDEHVATQMARDIAPFMPGLVYPEVGWQPENLVLELDKTFGTSDTSYIQ